ncbi:MAG TPA: 3TM-type holin [Alphaproteobacteria bacterium]|nr:3TM-type holin [Alphaproteobacteria bacterium]
MIEAIISTIARLLDKIIPDPAAARAAKLELLKAENQQVLSEAQTQLSAILAEAQSEDAWTSRARPSFLYLMYAVILLCVMGGILGIWYPLQTQQAAQNINALLRALPADLYTLFGMGYLGYTGARSFDKWRGGK